MNTVFQRFERLLRNKTALLVCAFLLPMVEAIVPDGSNMFMLSLNRPRELVIQTIRHIPLLLTQTAFLMWFAWRCRWRSRSMSNLAMILMGFLSLTLLPHLVGVIRESQVLWGFDFLFSRMGLSEILSKSLWSSCIFGLIAAQLRFARALGFVELSSADVNEPATSYSVRFSIRSLLIMTAFGALFMSVSGLLYQTMFSAVWGSDLAPTIAKFFFFSVLTTPLTTFLILAVSIVQSRARYQAVSLTLTTLLAYIAMRYGFRVLEMKATMGMGISSSIRFTDLLGIVSYSCSWCVAILVCLFVFRLNGLTVRSPRFVNERSISARGETQFMDRSERDEEVKSK
ncbi:MAG: hypothetical protein AAF802_11870 [Planctomycetota bacterium]